MWHQVSTPPRVVSPPNCPETTYPRNENLLKEFIHLLGRDVLVEKGSSNCFRSKNKKMLALLCEKDDATLEIRLESNTPVPETLNRFSFPSLSILHPSLREQQQQKLGIELLRSTGEAFANSNLSQPLRCNKFEALSAPSQMALNISSSVAFLAASNLRQYIKNHILYDQDKYAREGMARSLVASHFKHNGSAPPTVQLKSISTWFDIPEQSMSNRSQFGTTGLCEDDVVVTFDFTTEITVQIGTSLEKIRMNTTGATSAHFESCEGGLIESMEMKMDVAKFLIPLRNGARFIALKTITYLSEELQNLRLSLKPRMAPAFKPLNTSAQSDSKFCLKRKNCNQDTSTSTRVHTAIEVSPNITAQEPSKAGRMSPLCIKRQRLPIRPIPRKTMVSYSLGGTQYYDQQLRPAIFTRFEVLKNVR